MAAPISQSTLFISNIPYSWKNSNLEDVFSEIGPLMKCFVVAKKGTPKNKGVGYVKFADRNDAEKALKKLHLAEGRRLGIKYADKKVPKKQTAKVKEEEQKPQENNVEEEKQVPATKTGSKKIRKPKKLVPSQMRTYGSVNKPRLIVRNISFQCTEDDLKKAFSDFGEIKEVVIPLKSGANKRMFGFGFVEFLNLEDANEALINLNAKPILGRPIVVDWAIPKDIYQEHEGIKNTTNETEQINVNIQEEPSEEKIITKRKKKVQKMKEQASKKNKSIKRKKVEDESADEDSERKEKEDDSAKENSDNEDQEVISTKHNDQNKDKIKTSKKKKEDLEDQDDDEKDSRKSNKGHENRIQDPEEIHRTLFLRNLSFDTDEEDLEETFSKFGKLKYAVICRNSETGLSKGTGFIQFMEKAPAERCLGKTVNELDGELNIKGRRVIILPALNKGDCQQKSAEKVKKRKDNRNLYLAREGFIRENTQAAEGVSKTDLMKRLQVHTEKFNKLKNLNYFISPTRLCVFNLPLHYDDRQLKSLFSRTVEDRSAKIIEARVMRDLKTPNSKSKGFGYVEFSEHESALKCLRKLNNNPDSFTKDRRPIVEFAIENRVALNVKKKRQENYLLKQGMSKKEVFDKRKEQVKSFVGRQPSEGSHVKPFPSHFGAKIRHKKRDTTFHKEKKTPADKISRKQQKNKNMHEKINAVSTKKPRFGMEDKKFNHLVNKYRNKLIENDSEQRQKWFKE